MRRSKQKLKGKKNSERNMDRPSGLSKLAAAQAGVEASWARTLYKTTTWKADHSKGVLFGS